MSSCSKAANLAPLKHSRAPQAPVLSSATSRLNRRIDSTLTDPSKPPAADPALCRLRRTVVGMHNLTRAADSRPPPTAEQLGCRIKVILVVLVSQPKITNEKLEHTARGGGLTLLRAAVLTLYHTTFRPVQEVGLPSRPAGLDAPVAKPTIPPLMAVRLCRPVVHFRTADARVDQVVVKQHRWPAGPRHFKADRPAFDGWAARLAIIKVDCKATLSFFSTPQSLSALPSFDKT
ncbi:hypothetical protein PCANC_17285 [Puccinia coronata f. sp. avenae]|uniref:Uncharacterized protein n=1 Tax=Puccinia coronata f. sp. avenae TaxID=200324 RepID=A0A2N5UIH3_9BASI|nr:hypothetical protein PCANC_17285 [Puccinia coronata f. sp. avenae]